MHIEKLQLQNFRNYRQLDLALDRYLNFFTGENAQGKTNLLESLVFAASGRSFGPEMTVTDFLGENACSVTVNLYRQEAGKISIGCRKTAPGRIMRKRIGSAAGQITWGVFCMCSCSR